MRHRLTASALCGVFCAITGLLALAQDKTAAPNSGARPANYGEGKDLYEVTCLSCHQQNGMGQEGLAPPLVDSQWVTNSAGRLIRIVLHGMRGPVKVGSKVFEFGVEMPPLAVLSDEQISAVLSYIRAEWGHGAGSISPDQVKEVRKATSEREGAWTQEELTRIP